jgi:trans-aconitate methyltransferase
VRFPPAELIYAGVSLFFVEPARFPLLWDAIRAALQPGGVLAVHLMGANDSWADEGCTAIRRDEIDQMCDGLEVLELTERDEDGMSFAGPKH